VAAEETVARGRADQPPHRVRAILLARRKNVAGKRVRPRRIVHLLDFPHEIVGVIHCRCVRISLRGEPVQRVVLVRDRLTLAVGLLDQVVARVILIILAERGREIGLRHAPKGVIDERRLAAFRVGDAGLQFSMNKSKSKVLSVTQCDR
jgi:hypothetical protein